MCEPTTVALAALASSAAQAGLTIAQGNSDAKAQAGYQRQLTAATNTQAAAQASALRQQQAQANESSARETEKARLASQRAKATATVAAGEAGVSGNSVDALLAEYNTQLGQLKEATLRQQQLRDAAYQDEAEAVRTGASYQGLQINAPVAGPNVGAAALKFGADALGIYRDYKRDTTKG